MVQHFIIVITAVLLTSDMVLFYLLFFAFSIFIIISFEKTAFRY